jgi:hypothetical protein
MNEVGSHRNNNGFTRCEDIQLSEVQQTSQSDWNLNITWSNLQIDIDEYPSRTDNHIFSKENIAKQTRTRACVRFNGNRMQWEMFVKARFPNSC